MSFYESPRFPEKISLGATGGAGFSTEVVVVDSGREKRNARRSTMLHEWNVSHAVRRQQELDLLRAHFLAMNGQQHGFRFKDWSDYSCAITDGVVSGITSTTFQLVKRYSIGAVSKDRTIKKPIAAGFVLKNSGVDLVLTTDYTLNTVTGIVTTVTPKTAANLTWSGEFDVPMRYATDRFDAQIVERKGNGALLYSLDSVPLIEDPLV
jgi:uncharacterized protein (TIGR02217 family)